MSVAFTHPRVPQTSPAPTAPMAVGSPSHAANRDTPTPRGPIGSVATSSTVRRQQPAEASPEAAGATAARTPAARPVPAGRGEASSRQGTARHAGAPASAEPRTQNPGPGPRPETRTGASQFRAPPGNDARARQQRYSAGDADRGAASPATPRSGVSSAVRANAPGEGQKSNPGEPKERVEHPILFQHFFKSVGPRTYAAQVKRASNGNHYFVITEGRRDEKTGEVRKMRLNIFSEDFEAFFDLLRRTAGFIKAHPLPPEIQRKREAFWRRKNNPNPRAGKPRGPWKRRSPS